MAQVSITEFSNMGRQGAGTQLMPVAQAPALRTYFVQATSTSALGSFGANCQFARIQPDSPISFSFTSIATTTCMRMPADAVEYFGVAPSLPFSIIGNT